MALLTDFEPTESVTRPADARQEHQDGALLPLSTWTVTDEEGVAAVLEE